MRSSTVASKPLKHQNRHLKINYVHIIYFFDRCLDVVDLVVMKIEEGVVHIEVVADSVRSIRTSTKSGPHRIHAGMFKAKHFLSQPVFTVLSMYEHAITKNKSRPAVTNT